MTIDEIREFLEETYEKNLQNLSLEGWIDEKDGRELGNFTEQEIDINADGKHYYPFIRIQTFSNLQHEDSDIVGSIPYCMKEESTIKITVPKFGELSKEDIHKAIRYVIRELLSPALIFNVYYEGEQVCLAK